MGEIRKASFFNTLIIYSGFLIGAVNLVLIFNNFLSTSEIGLTRIFFSIASIVSQFAMLSLNGTAIKFAPIILKYSDRKELFQALILLTTFGLAICILAFGVFSKEILGFIKIESNTFSNFKIEIVTYIIIYTYFQILEIYAICISKSRPANLSREIVVRLFLSFLVLLYGNNLINFKVFILIYSFSYLPSVIYLLIKAEVKISYFTNFKAPITLSKLKSPAFKYGIFLFGGMLLAVLVQNLDSLIIAGILNVESTAIYIYAEYFASLALVPYRAYSSVLTITFSKLWRDKEIDKIKQAYYDSAVNQTIIAFGISGIIILSENILAQILKPEIMTGKYLLLGLLLAKLIDLSFGLNSELLTTSRGWMFNFISYVIILICIIPINYLSIKTYGINGSALSNITMIVCLNISRAIYMYREFKFKFISIRILKTWLFAVSIICIMYYSKSFLDSNILIDLLSITLFIFSFLFITIKFKLSYTADEYFYKFRKSNFSRKLLS